MRRLLPLLPLTFLAACVTQPPVPQPIPVFFTNASVQLGPEARQAVASAAAVAQQYPALHVQLIGYGLPTGVPAEPARLSGGRADAVKAELVRDGIAPGRILDYAGGAMSPAVGSPVESRRVDISFTR